MNETNWAKTLHGNVTESDRKALEKAKKMESKKIKQGYRWKRISPTLTMLVHCNPDGTPSEQGLERIAKQKERLGIK